MWKPADSWHSAPTKYQAGSSRRKNKSGLAARGFGTGFSEATAGSLHRLATEVRAKPSSSERQAFSRAYSLCIKGISTTTS